MRRRAVSAAKELIGRAGRFVGQQAIQLHGGMGMTDELAVGHYFKRLTAIDTTFGDSDFHLQRFAVAQAAEEEQQAQREQEQNVESPKICLGAGEERQHHRGKCHAEHREQA